MVGVFFLVFGSVLAALCVFEAGKWAIRSLQGPRRRRRGKLGVF